MIFEKGVMWFGHLVYSVWLMLTGVFILIIGLLLATPLVNLIAAQPNAGPYAQFIPAIYLVWVLIGGGSFLMIGAMQLVGMNAQMPVISLGVEVSDVQPNP